MSSAIERDTYPSETLPKQPWIASAYFDLTFILLPPILICAMLMASPRLFERAQELPLWLWVVLVMGVDVGHVYSTLFRTYLDPIEFSKRRSLYVITPILCWLGGILLYSLGADLFWRILAYVAVFHFVRQQYGFMMLYARKEKSIWRFEKSVDKAVIYAATIYPLIYWHTKLPRNFSWFMTGDFFSIPWPWVEHFTFIIYSLLIALYVLKEAVRFLRLGLSNLPKHLLLLGTLLSWYLGIVIFNGDLTFTLTNIITHGVPYIALVWIYERKNILQSPDTRPRFLVALLQPKMILLFVGLLVLFGFIEEGLWDSLLWRERGNVFKVFYPLPSTHAKDVLIWLVPILAVPQLTHYIVDGFIWKLGKVDDGVIKLLRE